MTCCPHCKARGAKLYDDLGPDYCGRCGKNWPAELSARIPADGVPPPPDAPHERAPIAAERRRSPQFAARVGSLAQRFQQGERFAEQMGRVVVPPTPDEVRARLEELVGVHVR